MLMILMDITGTPVRNINNLMVRNQTSITNTKTGPDINVCYRSDSKN